MATFGTKKFEEQSVRVFIKAQFCKAGKDECSIDIRPSRMPGISNEKSCTGCDLEYRLRYNEMKEAMLVSQKTAVIASIQSSCKIGACRTGVYDCGTCGPRTANINKTTKEYFQIQKRACDAYLLRMYGVPRDGIGFEHKDFVNGDKTRKYATHANFFANWQPFVGPDGRFECNYPALFLHMAQENAPELSAIVFPYTVKPRQSNASQLNRLSSAFSSRSSGGEIYGTNEVSSSSSSLRRYSGLSEMSEKSRQLLRKGSERMKSLTPMVSDFVQKEKERLDKYEEAAKDKYSSIKRKF